MSKLPFPFKFRTSGSTYIYTCSAPNPEGICKVSWTSDVDRAEESYEYYELEATRYIEAGLWKIVELVQPTYTESELSYIESLEDEVAKLEELCSDYTEIVAEKDAEIEKLRGMV